MLLTAWCAALAAFAGLAAAVRAAASVPVPATFRINATGPRTPSFAHVFHHTVGSGHATLGLRDDWRAHLRLARDALGLRQVRFHGIFDDDMGPVVSNSSSGGAMQYNFTRIGKTLDFIVRELGMALFVATHTSSILFNLAGCDARRRRLHASQLALEISTVILFLLYRIACGLHLPTP